MIGAAGSDCHHIRPRSLETGKIGFASRVVTRNVGGMRRPPRAIAACATILLTLAGLVPARGAERAVACFRIVDTEGNPLGDAVVSVFPEEAADAPGKPEPAEVVQVDQMFVPFVTVVPVGATVAFSNRDTVQHHVYSLSKTKRFEIPLHGGEADQRVTFDQPGVVTVGCNIHDWMVSYVVVVATPHFAKSEEGGVARLGGLPAGRHRVEVWHPRLANVWRSDLEVAPDASPETVDVILKLRPDRRQKSPTESRRKRY